MPFDGAYITNLDLTLNEGQQQAISEILDAIRARRPHLLTGYAGAGKTTLIQALGAVLQELGISVALAAPTHQAVKVLASKFRKAGLHGIPCQTVAALLSLTASVQNDRLTFKRRKDAEPVSARVVVVDECSMLDREIMRLISLYLPNSVVIFVGDPAQLGPIGEVRSLSFNTKSRSHLDVIERQGVGNPILDAADIIRRGQGGSMDWSWVSSRKAPPLGVFMPENADAWIRKAFMSSDFEKDSLAFRYMAWTNRRVDQINDKVRHWIYGPDIPTPFMPGEKALVREPLMRDRTVLINTNEEVTVLAIKEGTKKVTLDESRGVDGWAVTVPTWQIRVRTDDDLELDVHGVRDDRIYGLMMERVRADATIDRKRWRDFHTVQSSFIHLRNLYAMTIHTTQGSTFRHAFMDVADIRRRLNSNLLECQQLFYVGATRPSDTLSLIL